MIALRAVFLRELQSLALRFSTYAAGAACVAILGLAAAFGPTLQAGRAAMTDAFAAWPWAAAFLAPVLTASAWGREAETRLRETFMATPMPGWALILGRWMAGYVVLLAWLALSLLPAATLAASGALDWGLALAGLKASAWAGAAYLGVATAAGAVSGSVVLAYGLGAFGCLAITVFGWTPAQDAAELLIGDRGAAWLAAAAAPTRLEAAQFGVLTAPDGFYFVSLAALGLVLAALALSAQRERLK